MILKLVHNIYQADKIYVHLQLFLLPSTKNVYVLVCESV